ncbi:UNVERIFIED_CONTAM: hypothetical protein Slati_1365600 [Sesamum latifolium]|uniref:Uncharacterized protein n=1 Tax=Sesamum latifolium TaxID=2727402 RepID=A0AAW2XJJ0_9LAMI
MHTRSRTRKGNGGVGELEGISEHAPREEVQQPLGQRREEGNRRPGEQEEKGRAPPPMLQLTPEALQQMIEDASAQAASRAIVQYISEHAALA